MKPTLEPLCESEEIINNNLSSCNKKDVHCVYYQYFGNTGFCRKRYRIAQAEQYFGREKEKMMERYDGEEYHERIDFLGDRVV